MKTKSKQVKETSLNKALDELEGQLSKGKLIPDEMKNPNGGLATEGTDIADEVSASEGEAKKGKPEVSSLKKARKKKGMPAEMSDDSESEESSPEESGSEEDSDDMSKAGSEEGSDDVEKKYSASDESSSAESVSKAEASSASSMSKSKKKSMKKSRSVKKSLKEQAEKNEDLRKAMDVSSFLEGLVDVVSEREAELTKALDDLREEQSGFNGKLAKALIAIGRKTSANEELLKALVERLEGTPDPSRARKSILTKSEISERFGGGEGDDRQEVRSNPNIRRQVLGALIQKAANGEVPMTLVTSFESNLPIGGEDAMIIKSITDELKKSER